MSRNSSTRIFEILLAQPSGRKVERLKIQLAKTQLLLYDVGFPVNEVSSF
jgi:hypothetical protein